MECLMTPQEAVTKICATSKRHWNGTIYTFADQRYPEYDGRQVTVELRFGEYHYHWAKSLDS